MSIWNSVLRDDEYRIGALNPVDIVLDIGAHTGSFCVRAWSAGSRRVLGFEVGEENFKLARENVRGLDGVAVYKSAVMDTDGRSLYYTGHIPMEHELNTGVGTVFGSADQASAPIMTFDSIVGTHEIRLVKMDCEGSEWPILARSTKQAQVREYVGEWHLNNAALIEALFGIKPSLEYLTAIMEASGFEVRFYQRSEDAKEGAPPNPVGNFHFVRRDCVTSESFARDLEGRVRIMEYPCVSDS